MILSECFPCTATSVLSFVYFIHYTLGGKLFYTPKTGVELFRFGGNTMRVSRLMQQPR